MKQKRDFIRDFLVKYKKVIVDLSYKKIEKNPIIFSSTIWLSHANFGAVSHT